MYVFESMLLEMANAHRRSEISGHALRLRRFGRAVGVAFQIADDLLDADEESTGCSLVPLVGLERARARAEELLAVGLEEIEDLGERAEPLRALARFAVRRDA